jgi:hypothetical protein
MGGKMVMVIIRIQIRVSSDYNQYSETINKLVNAIITGYETKDYWRGNLEAMAVTKDAIISVTNANHYSYLNLNQSMPITFIEHIYVTIVTSEKLLYEYVVKLIEILRKTTSSVTIVDVAVAGGE